MFWADLRDKADWWGIEGGLWGLDVMNYSTLTTNVVLKKSFDIVHTVEHFLLKYLHISPLYVS